MRYPLRQRVVRRPKAHRDRHGRWLALALAGVVASWASAEANAALGAGSPFGQSDTEKPGSRSRDSLGRVHRVQAQAQPVLNVSKVILAEPAGETPLPIQVGPQEAIARNSFIRIRGLPAAAALTEGHSIGPGAWAIPIIALPNLKIALPVGVSGKSEASVALVTVDGTVIAETKIALVIASAALIAPGDAAPQSKNVASLGPSDTSGAPAAGSAADDSTRSSAPQQATEEQKRALPFITRGNEQLSQGNVAAARLFFQRAAEAGLAQGALALAATFDPIELQKVGAITVQADEAAARKWYERAQELGAAEAKERLKRLGAR